MSAGNLLGTGPWVSRNCHLIAVGAIAVVYAVALGALPLGGIWINDIGNRIIQVQGILDSNYSDYSLRYVGQAVDPDLHYAPIAYPFAVVRHDRLFSVYSPLFPLVASPFFRLLGYPGLYVIPPVASVLMLLGLARVVGEMGGGPGTKTSAVLIAALGTPVWFYSMTFWEHTLAVCLCVWAVVFLLRFLRAAGWRDLLLAAALSALGACFRPDLYAFLLVLLAVAAWKSPRSKLPTAALFASTAVAALVPLWLVQRATMGSPFGFHIGTLFSSTSGIARHIATRPAIFYSLFVRSSATVWLSLVLCAPFLILFAVNPKLSARRFGYALPLAGLAALAASFFIYRCFLGSHQLIACLGRSNSLFPAAPLLILGLMRCRDAGRPAQAQAARHAIWLMALAYAIVYGLAAPEMSKWGIHWGNRYLLVLYPLLAAPSAINLADWRSAVTGEAARDKRPASGTTILRKWTLGGKVVVIALIVASLAAQILSLAILDRKMDFSLRLNAEVAKRPEQVIITDQWWLGQELYSQFYRRLIFLATSRDQYRDLTRRLLEHGYTKVLFVAPPVPGERPEAGTVQVTDRGLGYWNLDLVPQDIESTRY